MKKIIITIVLGLSILTLISSTIKITQAYQSEPTIYYNGKNKEIVYFNVKDKDLFPNLLKKIIVIFQTILLFF